jgi:hypothetical protein
MQAFRISRLPESESTVDRLVAAMNRYELEPDYQRQSDLWVEDKKQLFIDSLINGYDVPKLYFHRPAKRNKTSPLFAIVDGKQRLEAIRGFIEGQFDLADDFEDVQAGENVAGVAAGLSYRQLTEQFPALAGRLAQYVLDVVVIETEDEEIIEELFSRLNEAVPLNAPEKRNAFGGAMPSVIRGLVRNHIFFTDRLPIANRRYKHFDLVTKFLLLTDRNEFVATKKRVLDDFVKAFRDARGGPKNVTKARALAGRVRTVLGRMAEVFEEQDELLLSIGLVTVYYMAFLKAQDDQRLHSQLTRKRLAQFDEVRRHNRYVARLQQQSVAEGRTAARGHVRRDLAIFDRLMQSPNDAQALEYRYRILRAFLLDKKFTEQLPRGLRRKLGESSSV